MSSIAIKAEYQHCQRGSAWPPFPLQDIDHDIDRHWNCRAPVPYRKAPIGVELALSCLTVHLMRNLTFGPRVVPICLHLCVCVCVCVRARKDTPKLDRAGQATNTRFWHLPHDLLTTRLLKFELQHNNVLQAVDTLWCQDISIPMGGTFSVQSADRHTLWKVKKARKRLRDWGVLGVSDEGYIFW